MTTTAMDVLHAHYVDIGAQLTRTKALTDHLDDPPEGPPKARPPEAMLSRGYRALAAAVEQLLDFDIGSVLKEAWSGHEGLVAAARESLTDGTKHKVTLSDRDVILKQHPSVDVRFDEYPLGTVEFTVTTKIDQIKVAGTVEAGRLTSLDMADCRVTLSISIGEEELASSEMTVRPHVEVNLGSGILLASGRKDR